MTKEIFQLKSNNKNNHFNFVLNINYKNISTKKSFRFQLAINEQHTKDFISSGLHEALPIETFQQIFKKLFHQNDITRCLIKKLSFVSGFRLYVSFVEFENYDNIDFSNMEVYKNQTDTTLICLPLIPYEMLSLNYQKSNGNPYKISHNTPYEKLKLRPDYCLTNAMDYYLIFNKAPLQIEFRKSILTALDAKQIQILNDIYNSEQIFHLNILFFLMKHLEVSHSSLTVMNSLYQELYAYCCDLLHIPLLSDDNNIFWNEQEEEEEEKEKFQENKDQSFYHQLDSHFLRRKKSSQFHINPLLILNLFQHFNDANLFHSVYDAYELFHSKANVNCVDDNALQIQWYLYNKYSDDTDLLIKNNQDVSHLMKHAIKSFPCNKQFIEYLHQRCMTSTFFNSFFESIENKSPKSPKSHKSHKSHKSQFEILFKITEGKQNYASGNSSSFFRVNNFKIESNIDSFIQLLHNQDTFFVRASLISHDKHKRLILAMLLADKHYSINEDNIAIMLLAYYLYFDRMSLSLVHKKQNLSKEIFWSLLFKDIETSLNYLYQFFNEKKHDQFKIIFRCETMDAKNESLKMIELNEIHKMLNREIPNGIQQIKNTYLTSSMILDEFYLQTNQKQK